MSADRPVCASVSSLGDRCVDYAGHAARHHAARSRGSGGRFEWTDDDPGAGALGAVIAAASDVRDAELALDRAMRHALDLGEVAGEVATAGQMSRATLYRRLAE